MCVRNTQLHTVLGLTPESERLTFALEVPLEGLHDRCPHEGVEELIFLTLLGVGIYLSTGDLGLVVVQEALHQSYRLFVHSSRRDAAE